MSRKVFLGLTLKERIQFLYEKGIFVTAIRYYGYKINLYMIRSFYVEVFYNHKKDMIEKVELLEHSHSRMNFYSDQVKLPIEFYP